MQRDLERLSAERTLEVWGLRVVGSSLRDPSKRSIGGAMATDDELYLAGWVEKVPGFEQAAPILKHIYAHHRPLESYPYRIFLERKRIAQEWDLISEGHRISEIVLTVNEAYLETKEEAAQRHGQLGLAQEGWSEKAMAAHLWVDFLMALRLRQRTNPFKLPARHEEAAVPVCSKCGLTAYNRQECPNKRLCGMPEVREKTQEQKTA